MLRIIKVKNATIADKTWMGQTLAPGEYLLLSDSEAFDWVNSSGVFASVGNGNLVVNDGTTDLGSVVGWKHLQGDTMPMSTIDNKKIAVHPSYKPEVGEGITYAVWTGAGDDVISSPSKLGDGELLQFDTVKGTAVVTKDIKFDHAAFGRVWIHEAYLKFNNGGQGDYISAEVVASATALQQVANLDMILDGNNVKYAPGGPGTGTHGFAAAPTLVPRTFSADGDWDYNGISLTPNISGTGAYGISIVDTPVHRYVNKIPCYGSCPAYFSMSSDETAELLPGYFLRVTCNNVSDTAWHASIFMEIYRERTVDS